MENPEQPPPVLPISAPAPVLNCDTAEADVRSPSVLPDATPFLTTTQPPVPVPAPAPTTATAPAPTPATAPASSPSTAPAPAPAIFLDTPASTQSYMHKNRLQQYVQKSRLQLPVYKTVNEGFINAPPKYRSTVLVGEVYFMSPNTFPNRKASEQDAARVALEYLSKKTKDEGFLLINEDMMVCKSILSEYSDKMNLTKPTYTTYQHKGSIPIFQSSLVFDGVVYTSDIGKSKKEAEQLAARAAIFSLLDDVGNPKSQQTLSEIITSKVKFHTTLQKVKSSHPSQIHPEHLVGSTEQHLGTSVNEDKDVNEDKEVKDSLMVNKVESNATQELSLPFQPQFRSPKPEASLHSARLPIEFVPSNPEEPLADHATGAKKRSKNKKKARKRLHIDNQLPTGTDYLSANQSPSCSVAQ